MSAPEQLQNDVHEALSTALGKHETGILTRWVVVAETVDQDGDRGMWTLTPPGATPWDSLGLLQHAIHLEQASTVHDAGEIDDND